MKKIIHTWGNPLKELNDIHERHHLITEVIYESIFEINFVRMNTEQYFFYKLAEICETYNLPLTVLVLLTPKINPINFDFSNSKFKNIKFVFWNTFWIARTYHLMSMHHNYNHNLIKSNFDLFDKDINLKDKKINYLFCSYNNIAKIHRIKMMNFLANYNLIDKGYISWRDVIRKSDEEMINKPKDMLASYYFYPELYTHWDPKILILDQSLEDTFNQEILPPYHTNSFVEIVTESDDNLFLISEKTSKPLLSKTLFLILGSKNFHRNLQKLGFKLYDELFDYEFDSYPTVEFRIAGIIKNLLKYKDYTSEELIKLIESVKNKIIFNHTLAVEYATNLIPEEIKELFGIHQIATGQPVDINNLFKILEDS